MIFLSTQNFWKNALMHLNFWNAIIGKEAAEIKLTLFGLLSKHIILESNISFGIKRVIKKPFIYKK